MSGKGILSRYGEYHPEQVTWAFTYKPSGGTRVQPIRKDDLEGKTLNTVKERQRPNTPPPDVNTHSPHQPESITRRYTFTMTSFITTYTCVPPANYFVSSQNVIIGYTLHYPIQWPCLLQRIPPTHMPPLPCIPLPQGNAFTYNCHYAGRQCEVICIQGYMSRCMCPGTNYS